jgi:hypothetical protein
MIRTSTQKNRKDIRVCNILEEGEILEEASL